MIHSIGGELNCASVYETSPVLDTPEEGHPSYLNTVLIHSNISLEPVVYHAKCEEIEKRLGRFRGAGGISRTIDIDIISFGQFKESFGELILPHPRATERRFVMKPLAEIMPDWTDEASKETAASIDKSLNDDSSQEIGLFLSQSKFLALIQEHQV